MSEQRFGRLGALVGTSARSVRPSLSQDRRNSTTREPKWAGDSQEIRPSNPLWQRVAEQIHRGIYFFFAISLRMDSPVSVITCDP